ncbi:metalloregulator ArsR/SmtB family transcription factor [Ectobacillus sp. JY-23]|uniref:ArsR/SmtB family transcription factor n=1 Tax=Ectobacillus sp. JY-23 TaxID=2933872 RepID=UPI001FF6A601|nr:metalloregulator ArsR/SmtB family transcription factor [Ectobacillus sp. JY-23]UOY94425.1 metalloregulator ArsR/SmtB family transcription factor [Ectobacillus sp. JY-23]
MFSVLADPTRRSILEMLADGERSVTELAAPFDMSLPAVSKHLKVLEQAKLVSQRKEGRTRYYCLREHALNPACEWMNRFQKLCTWKRLFKRK